MLLDHIGIQGLDHNRITGALWRKVQKHAIAVEGELKTSNGRLMGRLDLLLADVDSNGNMVGWLVADLKTGRTPNKELKSEVNRQLRLYRDILLDNNTDLTSCLLLLLNQYNKLAFSDLMDKNLGQVLYNF